MQNEHNSGQVVTTAAEVYEQFFVPALFAEWPARVLDLAGVRLGESVLDVGCGTGILAREVAGRVGPAGSVTGVDINQGMLAIARQKGPGICWRQGAAEQLAFPDASFDCVVSQFALMFFADQVGALTEMARVLRGNGRLVVAVWDSLAATPGYAAVAELLDELIGPTVAQAITAPYSLGDPQTLLSLFAEAGLENVALQTITGTARFASIDAWIYTDIKGWTLADVINEAEYDLLQRYARQKLARFERPDGSVAFPAPAHLVIATALQPGTG